MRTYSELILLPTFKERFEYLKLDGIVGESTFGSNRWLNQKFYSSREWKEFKRGIIIRDHGCDLGIEGLDITYGLTLHHIEPLIVEDFKDLAEALMNPENVICTTHRTHNAIHYGTFEIADTSLVERTPNDTCPWKR